MVTCICGHFRNIWAFSCSTCWPCALTSNVEVEQHGLQQARTVEASRSPGRSPAEIASGSGGRESARPRTRRHRRPGMMADVPQPAAA
jgi:hypothetical protein